MIYKYLSSIDKTDLFIYLCGIICAAVLFGRLPLTPRVVGGIVCGILVAIYVNDRTISTNGDFLRKMDEILESEILKTKDNTYLHKDSAMLEFLDGYREYYQYNPVLYRNFVSAVNGILKLRSDLHVGTAEHNMDYEVLRDLKPKIMNMFHAFVYTVPHTPSSVEKFQLGMRRLDEMLRGYIDTAHTRVTGQNKAQTITTETKFHYRNHPRPRDTDWEPHYQFWN